MERRFIEGFGLVPNLEDITVADVGGALEVSTAISNEINEMMEKWVSMAEAASKHHPLNPLGLIGTVLMEAGIGALIMSRFTREQIEKAAWDISKFYTDPAAMAQIASFAEPDSEFAAHMHHLLQTQTTKKAAN
jgi:hypothetical protein